MIARLALVALAALGLAASARANPAAPPDLTQVGELALAGVRYGQPLAAGQVAWLIAAPAEPDAPTACDGCRLELLACNTVCTYRLTARSSVWRATVGARSLSQGGRLYFPWVIT